MELLLSSDVIIWDDNTPLFFPENFTHSCVRYIKEIFECRLFCPESEFKKGRPNDRLKRPVNGVDECA